MFRRLIQLAFLGAIALLVAPFVLSSLYTDRRGITIDGRIYAKREGFRTSDSSWSRHCEVTVQYSPPDRPGTAFHTESLDTAAFDSLHKGETVPLHYLLRRDIPQIPLADLLSRMGILPVVRLAGRSAFSGLDPLIHGAGRRVLDWILAAALLLVVWRFARWPFFGWAVAVCCVIAFAVLLAGQFPRPTPAPAGDVRQATGRVTGISVIDHIFEGSRTRGILADEPIQIVGVEFVPAGRTEPVLAVDLVDAGSIPALKTDALLAIDYEAASPRTAHIHAATRTFAARNLRGMALEGLLGLAVIVALLALANWIGRAWTRLLVRRP